MTSNEFHEITRPQPVQISESKLEHLKQLRREHQFPCDGASSVSPGSPIQNESDLQYRVDRLQIELPIKAQTRNDRKSVPADALQQGLPRAQTWDIPKEIEEDGRVVHAVTSVQERVHQFLKTVDEFGGKFKVPGSLEDEFKLQFNEEVSSLSKKFNTALKRALKALEVIDTDKGKNLVEKGKTELKEIHKEILDLNKDLDTFNELDEKQRKVKELLGHSSKQRLDIDEKIKETIKDYSQALDSHNLEYARKNLEDTYKDVMDQLQKIEVLNNIDDIKNKFQLIDQKSNDIRNNAQKIWKEIRDAKQLRYHIDNYVKAGLLFYDNNINTFENKKKDYDEKFLSRNKELDEIEKKIQIYKSENRKNDIENLEYTMYSIQNDLKKTSLEDLRWVSYTDMRIAVEEVSKLLKPLMKIRKNLLEEMQKYDMELETTQAQISHLDEKVNELTTLSERKQLQQKAKSLTDDFAKLKEDSNVTRKGIEGLNQYLDKNHTNLEAGVKKLRDKLELLISDNYHPYFSSFQRTEDPRNIDQSLRRSCAIVAMRWILREQGRDIQTDATEEKIAQLIDHPEGGLKNKAIEAFSKYGLHAEWTDLESFDHIKQLRDEKKSIYVVLGKQEVQGHVIAIDKVWKESNGNKMLTFVEGRVRSKLFQEEFTGKIGYEELRKYLHPKHCRECVLVVSPRSENDSSV